MCPKAWWYPTGRCKRCAGGQDDHSERPGLGGNWAGGTTGSSTKANAKSCSWNPTTPGSRTNRGEQIRKEFCRRNEDPGLQVAHWRGHIWMLCSALGCLVWDQHWYTGASPVEAIEMVGARARWVGGEERKVSLFRWGGEAPGACNYLTGEDRGNRSELFLEVHRERIGSHGDTLQPGELLLDARWSWAAPLLATVKG